MVARNATLRRRSDDHPAYTLTGTEFPPRPRTLPFSTEIHVENFDGSVNFDMRRDEDRTFAAAGRERTREPAMASTVDGAGGALGGGSLDDDIPFAPCWQ